jgi:uncharacterized RDD family membrane protein YckC
MSGLPPGGSYPPPPPSDQPWGPPPSPGGPPPQPQGPWQQPPPSAAGQGYWEPPRYGGPATLNAPKAGFWARFGALLLDGLILSPPNIIAWIVLVAGPKTEETCSVDSSGDIVIGGDTNAICEVPSGSAWAIAIVLWIIGFALAITYTAVLQGKRGATWGQQALNIRTVDQYTGQPIGPGRAIGRLFARILSGIPCYLGYFWMLWDEQKQTWHDKIVGSVVVQS